jgi:hypothetical protein
LHVSVPEAATLPRSRRRLKGTAAALPLHLQHAVRELRIVARRAQ